MPRKKTKKATQKRARRPVALPNVVRAGSPEDVQIEPAISLVGRAQDLIADIREITGTLEDRHERLANVKDQLRSIKFDNGKLSVEFGWNEGPETPGVRIGIFAGREFAYVEASLEELREMLNWCNEQL